MRSFLTALGRLARAGIYGFGALIGMTALVLLLVAAWLQTPPGREMVAGLAERAASEAGLSLQLDGLASGLPLRLAADSVTLSDDRGDWLSLTAPEITWSPTQLLRGLLRIDRLAAEQLTLIRIPTGAEDPEEEDSGLSVPDLPFRLAVGEIDLPQIELGEAVIGTALSGSAVADFSYGGFDSPSRVDITLVGSGEDETRLTVSGSVRPRADRAALSLELVEPAGARSIAALGLPNALPWRIAVDSDGPLDAFPVSIAADYGETEVLDIGGTVGLARRTLDFALELNAQPASVIENAMLQQLGPLSAALEGRMERRGRIVLDTLTVSSRGIDVAAAAQIDGRRIDIESLTASAPGLVALNLSADGSLDLAASDIDLAVIAEADLAAPVGDDMAALTGLPPGPLPLSGDARGEFTIAGALTAPQIDGRLAVNNFDSAIDAAASLLGDSPSLTLSGGMEANGAVAVDTLALDGAALSVTGQLAWLEGALTSDSRLAVTLPDIGAVADGLGGNAALTVTAQPSGGPLAVRLQGAVDNVRTGDRALGSVAFDGSASGLTGTPEIALTLDGSLLGLPLAGDLRLPADERLAADLAIGDSRLRAAIDTAAPLENPELELSITDLSAFARLTGIDASGAVTVTSIADTDALSFDITGQNLILVGVGLAELSGTVTPNLDTPAESRAEITAREIAAPVGLRFRQIDLELSGTGRGARLTVAAQGQPVRLDAEALIAPDFDQVTLNTLNAALADRELALTEPATLTLEEGIAITPLRLTGDDLSLDARLSQDNDGAIDGALSLTLDLEWLQPLFRALPDSAAGRLELAATATGTVDEPAIEGTLSLQEGSYRNADIGLELTEMTALARYQDGGLTIEQLVAETPAGGSASASGVLGLQQAGMPVDMRLTLDRALLADTDLVLAVADADLTLKGELASRADLQGEIVVREAELQIPSNLPSSVPTVEVTEINTGEETEQDEAATSDPEADGPALPERIGLELTVSSRDSIQIGGRGLDAVMGGALQIGGTAAEPEITGGFELDEGTFDLLGNELSFETGTVTLDQVGKLNPRLDFRAVTTIDGSTIIIALRGRADDPQISVSSRPPSPEDEIFSKLLFGKVTDQLTAIEAVQLANAVATLTGTTGAGRTGVLRRLRETTGLDLLEIDGGDDPEGGFGVRAGRNVTDRVFVGVRQGTTPESTVVEVEADVTNRLKIRSEIGADADTSLGLRYEWDY